MTTPSEFGSYSDVLGVIASRCCVCNRRLTDASSVENGIGPVCSQKYYSDAHVPDEQEILRGTGSLAVSGLPDNVMDAVLHYIDRGDARKACNVMVYYASAFAHERDIILKVAAVMRDFGYSTLADKLEEDRSQATLNRTADEGWIRIGVRKKLVYGKMKLLNEIKGACPLGAKGPWEVWEIPNIPENQEFVEAIIGFCLHDKPILVRAGFFGAPKTGVIKTPHRTFADLAKFTGKKRRNQQSLYTAGAVSIVDNGAGSQFEFWSPYNAGWLAEMKSSIPSKFRRWNGRCWIIHRKFIATIQTLAQRYYNVQL